MKADTDRPRRLPTSRAGRVALAGCAALLGLAATSCSSSGSGNGAQGGNSSGQTNTTTLTINAPVAVDNAPIDWALSKGLFAKAGLTLKFIQWTSQNALPTALNGQASISVAGGGAVVGWLSQGQPLSLLAAGQLQGATLADTSTSLIADPASGVKSLKDLDGKSVALTGLSGTSLAFAEWQIKTHGGDPSKVKFTVVPFAGMVTALKSHKVAAAQIVDPYRAQALASGMTYLGPGFTPNYSNFFFTTQSYATSHHAVLVKFLQVLKSADQYATSHWPEVSAIYAQDNQLTAAEAKYLPTSVSFSPEVQDNALSTDVQVMQSAKLMGSKPVNASDVIFR